MGVGQPCMAELHLQNRFLPIPVSSMQTLRMQQLFLMTKCEGVLNTTKIVGPRNHPTQTSGLRGILAFEVDYLPKITWSAAGGESEKGICQCSGMVWIKRWTDKSKRVSG